PSGSLRIGSSCHSHRAVLSLRFGRLASPGLLASSNRSLKFVCVRSQASQLPLFDAEPVQLQRLFSKHSVLRAQPVEVLLLNHDGSSSTDKDGGTENRFFHHRFVQDRTELVPVWFGSSRWLLHGDGLPFTVDSAPLGPHRLGGRVARGLIKPACE